VPRFTVLLPVHRPPAMLPYAIETVLDQTLADLELFVICDGAPETTVARAQEYAARDSRVTVLAFPKGERHGEAHRHRALGRAGGEFVAHICDDDLWFPDHLAELARLLSAVDFGHVLHTQVRSDGGVEALPADLEDPLLREQFLGEAYNRFGPTFAGYRLDTYRRLPEGWAPAPPTTATDLHMWRKFLRCAGLRHGTRMAITAIHFPTPGREHMSLEDRARENHLWLTRLRETREREMVVHMAWRSIVDQALRAEREQVRLIGLHSAARDELARFTATRHELEATLRAVLQSRSWRLTAPLRAGLAAARRLRPARGRNGPAPP
jgi:glycosyltransferase involved in cell wall biosynthesis